MNFKEAKKTFELLKMAYVTGAISRDELCRKVDTELEVTGKDASRWKIDEDSGLWLRFDEGAGAWREDQPEPIAPTKPPPESFSIKITPPEISAVPTDVYNDWAKQHGSSKLCQKCGRALKPENKFCTGCGEKRSEQ